MDFYIWKVLVLTFFWAATLGWLWSQFGPNENAEADAQAEPLTGARVWIPSLDSGLGPSLSLECSRCRCSPEASSLT